MTKKAVTLVKEVEEDVEANVESDVKIPKVKSVGELIGKGYSHEQIKLAVIQLTNVRESPL